MKQRSKDFSKSEEKIKKLLEQFRDYTNLWRKLKILEIKLKNNPEKESLVKNEIKKIENEQKIIWDEMKFDNPYIWMKYKFLAYLWLDFEIININDFRKHCENPGHICHQRLDFLNNILREKFNLDFFDDEKVNWDEKIEFFLERWILQEISKDEKIIEKWLNYEYFKKDWEISKWQNYKK